MSESTGFEDRVVVITGAANGIGRDMAREVVRRGGRVAIVDVDVTAADAVTAELGTDVAMGVPCDVSDEVATLAAAQAVGARFGGIDVLVNNAGLHLTRWNAPVTSMSSEEWHQILGVNVIGVVNCARACRPYLARGKDPAILNLSSISGSLSHTVYGITKLAVRGLTVALATEFARDGIRVNAVAPGAIGSDNALTDLPDERLQHLVHKRQLIHRQGSTADVVSAMTYLCSGASSFVTGQTLDISGGYPLYV